jgi:hypothetical protein
LQDAIEQVASELFDESPHLDGYVIRIFAKHIKRQAPMSPSPQSVAPEVVSLPIIAPDVAAVQDDLTSLPESGDDNSQNAADSHENGELDHRD